MRIYCRKYDCVHNTVVGAGKCNADNLLISKDCKCLQYEQRDCIDKQILLDLIESHLIEYQEEVTSKWSNPKERYINQIKYDTILELMGDIKQNDDEH